MSKPPFHKKSESLEIRLPHETKTAFMHHCRQDGRSASETVRAFIDQQLTPSAKRRVGGEARWRILLGTLAALILAGAALPSLARPTTGAQFERLDVNHDGMLSRGEFAQRAFQRLR